MNHLGSLRVLSADGQNLGYGYPFRDETGETTLYKEPAYAQSQGYYPGQGPYQGGYHDPGNPYAQGMPGNMMRPNPRNPYYRQDGGYGAYE